VFPRQADLCVLKQDLRCNFLCPTLMPSAIQNNVRWYFAGLRFYLHYDVYVYNRPTIIGHPASLLVVCSATCPSSLPKRILQRVRSGTSFFNFQYPFVSVRSSSSCLRLLPRLPVTSVFPSMFPSKTCSRRQSLYDIRPFQFAFLPLI
jgi:hypothetical protein